MKTSSKAGRPGPRRHGRARPRSHRASVARPADIRRPLEVPLPPALRHRHGLAGSGVALVEVGADRLTLRFVEPTLSTLERPAITEAEEQALVQGGVAAVTGEETRIVEARSAAAYQHLRATSLSVEAAARRLGVNASRIRQRLGQRSLYGIKDGNAWIVPAFQFHAEDTVPGIDEVVRRLPPDIGAVAVARWFESPNPDLCTRDDEERPMSPLQWLLAGNPPGPAAALAAAL